MHRALVVSLVVFLVPVGAEGKDTGRITGRVKLADGRPLPGVSVEVDGTPASTLTDSDGRFRLKRVPTGTHSVTFSWRDQTTTRSEVVVEDRTRARIEEVVDWEVGYFEDVTVAVSRRPERIVDAPASVTVIQADEIGRQAAHGQVPKLFEFTPGVEITQINMVDFLVSTRGFNGNLNRRVAVQVDGRDLTDPFIGAMEWSIVSYPLDDFENAELVRGPAAALYGANTTGGIFNLITKHPRDSQGGLLRVAAGGENSTNADLRWATGLGGEWYARVTGGMRRSDGFSVSRLDDTEYSEPCPPPPQPRTNCLPLETIPFPEGREIDIAFGALRIDKYLRNGTLFTIEGGTTDYHGPVFINFGGRGQLNDVDRPWARVNASGKHWNVLANYSKRDAMATNLNSGAPFLLDADHLKLEAQTNWSFVNDKVRLVAGGSLIEEDVDANIMSGPSSIDEQALFTQVDWEVSRRIKLVGALRWDDSSLFDARVSPRASLVYAIDPDHAVRVTYNEAFQLPTYGDFFLQLPFPPGSADTTSLNDICSQPPYGIDCGLDGLTTGFLLGNESLEVEEVTTLELGYKGVIGTKTLLNIDLWNSAYDNFVTDAVQITPAGQTNPDVAPWEGPLDAETTPIDPADCAAPGFSAGTVADCVRASAPDVVLPGELTNLDAASIIAARSFTNFGEVDTRGIDVGLQHFFSPALRLSFAYSWFDFEVQDDTGGTADLLVPNAPENKASLGLGYVVDRWDASIRGRWVDEFLWTNGGYRGTVESFTTVDLFGNYRINQQWRVGLNVANLFDEAHWEAFGGDLIGRRALAQFTFAW